MVRSITSLLCAGCFLVSTASSAQSADQTNGSAGRDPTINSVPGKGVEADRISERYPDALPLGKKGLRYIVTVEGEEEGEVAAKGDTVTMNYRGTLWDGTQFDSSYDRGKPFVFPLGRGKVIAGWDDGIAGMKVGEKRTLIIPYALAYGERGRPPSIPRRATLIFDVELLAVD